MSMVEVIVASKREHTYPRVERVTHVNMLIFDHRNYVNY